MESGEASSASGSEFWGSFSLVDVSEQQTGGAESDDEQDEGKDGKEEESSSASEESHNNGEDSGNNTNDTNDPEQPKDGGAVSSILWVGGVQVGFSSPVDHQPSEKNHTEGSDVEGVGSELESVGSNSEGAVGDEEEQEGADGGQSDEPTDDLSSSADTFVEGPGVWHMVIP